MENTKRIERFRELVDQLFSGPRNDGVRLKADGSVWEDAASRKERMRAEGLRRAEEARLERESRLLANERNDEV